MNFDQGQFNFDANGSEGGYRKWREKLDEEKRAFESRWGVILGRKVCVSLMHHAKPLTGLLEWISEPTKTQSPRFRIKGIEFAISEIESIVRLEESGPDAATP